MFKYILLFIFLISAPIYCGNWWSLRPSQPIQQKIEVNPYEPLQKELMVYLDGLKLDDITTVGRLEEHVRDSINRDIRDKNIFPAFNALWSKLEAAVDEEQARKVRDMHAARIREFLAQKIEASPTLSASADDENLED